MRIVLISVYFSFLMVFFRYLSWSFMAAKNRMKVLDYGSSEKKLLGYIRVTADSTYNDLRKEIIADGLVDGSFTFIIDDDDDGEACALNPIQEERWQVENAKVVGIKRGLNTKVDGAQDEDRPAKRQCEDLEEYMEDRGLKESNKFGGSEDNICGSPEYDKNMLKSTSISMSTLQMWQIQCEKVRKKLKEQNPSRDDRFELSTKDLNGNALIQIWCHECGTFYGSGYLRKQSAYSCLSNFMRTHVLESQAHQSKYLAHRGLNVNTTNGFKDVGESGEDHKTAILLAVEEMHAFNSTHEGKCSSFE